MGSHREVSSLPLDAEFEVFTDNNSLFHFRTAPLGALEQRWAAQLVQFHFTVKSSAGVRECQPLVQSSHRDMPNPSHKADHNETYSSNILVSS